MPMVACQLDRRPWGFQGGAGGFVSTGASRLCGKLRGHAKASMKITTWNVNSLTARLQHVLDWLAANPVDVLCLQELKLTDDKFPLDAIREAGYPHCAVFGQKTYNGVAILSRTEVRDMSPRTSPASPTSTRA
jgi:endonuclease/exonuclease/phosphatase family metal-dependent hydrolase